MQTVHNYHYEDFFNLFKPYIKEGDWCLDVGANNGNSCAEILKLIGNNGKLICFEPIPEFVEILKDRFKNDKNIDIHKYACDTEYAKKEFDYGISNTNGNGGLWNGYEHERGNRPPIHIEVDCVNTSDFLTKTYSLEDLKNNLKFIKIDCEGHDYAVIKSLKPLIDVIKPTIFCEWWFFDSAIKLFDVVEEMNYSAYRSDNPNILANKDFIGKGLFSESLGTGNQFLQQSHDLILIPN